MPKIAPRWLIAAAAGVFVLGLLGVFFAPRPLEVDTSTVRRGTLQVAVAAEGKTRVRDRYVLAAPVAGALMAIPLCIGVRDSGCCRGDCTGTPAV